MESLVDFEDNAIQYFGKMAAYEKDGMDGKLIIRNFVRAMKAWDTERIFGEFWIGKFHLEVIAIACDCILFLTI